WPIDVDDARHFYRPYAPPVRHNRLQETTHPVPAGGNGVRSGAAYPGAEAVDPSGDARGMDRLVAQGPNLPTHTPGYVHRRLVVHVRRHSQHHLRAPLELPLRRLEDRPPVSWPHHGIHHAAEYGARR